jgi:hypothetical protein
MRQRLSMRGSLLFLARISLAWIVMTAILVVVPDALERWVSIEIGRVAGWAVAVSVWVIVVEPHWRARFGPFVRVALQLGLWMTSAMTAIWISEQARLPTL